MCTKSEAEETTCIISEATCLHVPCSSACLCVGVEHIRGQSGPLYYLLYPGDANNEHLASFPTSTSTRNSRVQNGSFGTFSTAAHSHVWWNHARARLLPHLLREPYPGPPFQAGPGTAPMFALLKSTGLRGQQPAWMTLPPRPPGLVLVAD